MFKFCYAMLCFRETISLKIISIISCSSISLSPSYPNQTDLLNIALGTGVLGGGSSSLYAPLVRLQVKHEMNSLFALGCFKKYICML